jgi:hypothetical protein
MDNAITKNTLLVYLEDMADASKVYFFGISSKADWTQSISTNLIRGAWGNLVQGVLNSDKQQDITITPVFDMESILALQTGTDFENGAATVKKTECGLPITDGTVAIKGEPVGTTVKVFDKYGKAYTGTYATGTVTVTTPPEDGYVSVVYDVSVTGNVLDLRADKFPKNYKLWGYTISVDPDTNEQISDVYIYFEKVQPDGNFTKTWAENENSAMPVKFLIMSKVGSNTYGKYISVPVAEA